MIGGHGSEAFESRNTSREAGDQAPTAVPMFVAAPRALSIDDYVHNAEAATGSSANCDAMPVLVPAVRAASIDDAAAVSALCVADDEDDGSEVKAPPVTVATGQAPCNTPSTQQPVIIQADAPLTDGLRMLLVHHLKRSVGSDNVSLSESQAELLEHHLARLVSYAQKIVHTLAFATRFLSKPHCDGDSGSSETPRPDAWEAPEDGQSARGLPVPSKAGNSGPDAWRSPPPPPAEPKPPKKSLKLNDDEILSLYKSAQQEARIEADWRGISDAPLSRGSGSRDDNRGHDSALFGGGVSERTMVNQEYVHMLSSAMQEDTTRSPGAFAAEILDNKPNAAICCRPAAPAMRAAVQAPAGRLSAHHRALSSPGDSRPGESQR